MKNCDPKVLSRYIDHEVTLPFRREIEEHLRSCFQCRDELEKLYAADRAVRTLGERTERIPRRTETRIRNSVSRRKGFASRFSAARVTPAAMGSAIAALLVLLSANLGWQYTSGAHGSGPGQTAEVQHILAKQSTPLQNARRTSAILGGRGVTHSDLGSRFQTMFTVD